jgi:membrane protease YdiL (CAAX protease family)
MVVESAIYAVTLGTFIVFVMQQLLGFELVVRWGDTLSLGATGEAVVVSLGAGVHEELVFRLGLMAGTAALLGRAGLGSRAAVVLALAGSSILFSAAHHVGAYADPFSWDVFAFRTIAGLVFGLVFYFRSLGHAVYTHFLYDFYVLVVRR